MSFKGILTTLVILSALLLPLAVTAQEEPVLKVTEAAIATSVENLVPKGVSDRFPGSVGKLYAFTRIAGATKETLVWHLWFYGDKLMAEVSLPVKSVNWRTYSSKRIVPGWTGEWRVDVTNEDGLLLETLYFTIE
ncbi:MAG: DUF2914 domain-containing protein [Nitrospirae bacterium]|nr:DUF2914 domain-containing protein [Nitrospirota bacterium]